MKYLKYLNKNIPSLEGKIYVITGSNSGIGFSLAMQLAYKGASIVMACRSKDRAIEAKEKILKEVENAKIDILLMDQSSFESIRSFVKELTSKYEHIDGFIFNAGIYHPKKGMVTKEGIALTIGTNYVGPYYLSMLLKDYFIKCHTRIVVINSFVQPFGRYKASKALTNKYSVYKSYNVSKRCDIALAVHLYDELKDNCLVLLSHPGMASTNIAFGKDSGVPTLAKKLSRKFMYLMGNDMYKSSLTTCLALSEDALPLTNYVPRLPFHIKGYPKKIKTSPDKYRDDELYKLTEELITSKL